MLGDHKLVAFLVLVPALLLCMHQLDPSMLYVHMEAQVLHRQTERVL